MVFVLDEVPGKRLSIAAEGTPILTYCYGDSAYPPYFHPLYAPNGQVITEGADAGQRYAPGICFTFGTVNGETGVSGEVKREVLAREHFPWKPAVPEETSLTFEIATRWHIPEPLLVETCTATVYPRQTHVQVINVAVALHAPSRPLAFGGDIGLGYHAAEMEYRKAVEASGRIGASEVNGHLSAWSTLGGIATDTAVGVAIFPHPENGETRFRAEDVSAGFLFAHTMPFTVGAGATRTLRYRVLIYLGDVFTVDIWDYHQDYIKTDKNA